MRLVDFKAETLGPLFNRNVIELAGTRCSGISLLSRVLASTLHSFHADKLGEPIELVLIDDELSKESFTELVCKLDLTKITVDGHGISHAVNPQLVTVESYDQLIAVLDSYDADSKLVIGASLARAVQSATAIFNLREYLRNKTNWQVVLGLHSSPERGKMGTLNNVTVYYMRDTPANSGLFLVTVNEKQPACSGFWLNGELDGTKAVVPASKLDVMKRLQISDAKVTVTN